MAAAKEMQEAAAAGRGDSEQVAPVAGDARLQAGGSPVLASTFRHDRLEASGGEVTVPGVEGPALQELPVYVYSFQAPRLSSMAALLAAADTDCVPGLKGDCERELAAQLTVENAAATAVLAVGHSCLSLAEAAVAFIKADLQVLATQGWADAVLNHPDEVAEVSRLLGEPSAEYRRLPGKECGRRLIEASKEGVVEELRALLAAGANVEARDEDMWTALHWAAVRGHEDVVRCLVEGGADVETRDSRGNTPMHWAAYRGHAAVVRLLAASSGDPNAMDVYRRTPLHYAARQGHAEVAAVLLDVGADRGAWDDHGHIPLDLAMQNREQQLADMLS
ncbi:60 kDa lysophospholipase-like [Schistocerca piceifrons]|uniref:60 kDa lysophospholipase-like n=1 Tax=Schistocerca piceifrons TaxID=274613 RepID=UPI001F5F7EA9|nr:60 kDa lysophospholipase-like [Schistocerca piceifrons]